MKGLIIKDIINLKKYSRTILLVSAFYILFSFMIDSMTFLTGMIVLMFAVSTITSFSYDNQSGWDVYALTLPLPRRDIVLSKYALGLLLTVSGALLAMLVNWLTGLFMHKSNFAETLMSAYVLFAVSLFFLCVLLPLLYQFGPERSRMLIIAVFAIPSAAFVVLSGTSGLTMPDEALIGRLMLFSPLVLAACAFVSIAISCRIFGKKQV